MLQASNLGTYLRKRLHFIKVPFRGMALSEIWNLIFYAPENLREFILFNFDDFDKLNGTDTTRLLKVSKLNVVGNYGPEAIFNWPTDSAAFRPMLRALGERLTKTTFIDIGCGRGRQLFLAAEYSFKKIIGLDYSERLCMIARKNIQILSAKYPYLPQIHVECADITNWKIPDGPLVIYLFDPFGTAKLQIFIENLTENLRRNPRPCYFIYRSPAHRKFFEKAGLKIFFERGRNWKFQHPWVIYQVPGRLQEKQPVSLTS